MVSLSRCLAVFLLAIMTRCPTAVGLLDTPKLKETAKDPIATLTAGKETISSLIHHVAAIVATGAIGFAVNPLVGAIFNVTHIENEGDDFKQTFLFGATDSVTAATQTCGGILFVDLVRRLFDLRLPFVGKEVDLFSAAPKVGFAVWTGLTLSTVKRTIFKQMVTTKTLGRVSLYDRLLDFVLSMATAANILGILKVDFGVGIQSIFAASGVSALVFSLASKGLVEQIVAGFVVQAWDAIEEGESVRLGDGTEGKVKRIGLVETEIEGSDNISVRIPNSQLTGKRVSNISRMTRSQVKQILRFKYSDLDRLPKVLNDIKAEIAATCPGLITDGSKSFQALLTQYASDHVQALINCHFDIKPGSGEHAETQQKVMLAISSAMKRNNIEFAIPSVLYQTDEAGIFSGS
jgi:small-conductance mechanosensitive channel